MTISKDLRLVLVTPETTLLDEPVQALRFPLFDGQIGILPGRAPLVGRLGSGELLITTAAGKRKYYVDGGFVQVKGSTVSLLTNRAQLAATLDPRQAEDELQAARQRHPKNELEFVVKESAIERARHKLAVARRSH